MDDRSRSRPNAAPSPDDGAPASPELEELGYAALPAVIGPRNGRRWLSVALPLVILTAIVVVGLAFAEPASDSSPPASSPIAAAPSDAAPSPRRPAAAAEATPPADEYREILLVPLRCEGVPLPECRRAAEAAIAILEPGHGRIAEAAVWTSLICAHRWDCPRRWLADGEAIGSVVLEFERGRDPVAVNVIDIPVGRLGALGGTVQAWVTSWQPAPTLAREADGE